MTEFREKQMRIRELLQNHNRDALLLKRVSSFAWATWGVASYVNIATSNGASQFLITKTRRFLITDNIEATHLIQEEKITDQRWEIIILNFGQL
jgi:Xaa-Pro aminopeptidase